MIIRKCGNIFTSEMQTLVNAVNCSGIMGAGIAYEFKLRYPEMFEKYKVLCEGKQLTIGKLWLFKPSKEDSLKKILNFPTKNYWKLPTKVEYLEKGLQKFLDTYQEKEITSIAFPLLGASNGGLDKETVLDLMEKYLSKIDIPVEIWDYDPNVSDDLFETFKTRFLSLDNEKIKLLTSLRTPQINALINALNNPKIKTMSSLLLEKGIGDTTLERAFRFIQVQECEIAVDQQRIQGELFGD